MDAAGVLWNVIIIALPILLIAASFSVLMRYTKKKNKKKEK